MQDKEHRVVLMTYVLGMNTPVTFSSVDPMYESQNKVSRLSLGIAFQLVVTAGGKIEMECTLSQKGFIQYEANDLGVSNCMIKGYDYPNPVLDEADIGKVIGRQGRIIKAIRTLARAAASQDGFRVEVELAE